MIKKGGGVLESAGKHKRHVFLMMTMPWLAEASLTEKVRAFCCRELDRETEVQTRFLHLFGDFSQLAISRQMSGDSADISKRYFQNCTASSNIPWSASKSLILQR
jgi:hypothetical protein